MAMAPGRAAHLCGPKGRIRPSCDAGRPQAAQLTAVVRCRAALLSIDNRKNGLYTGTG